MTLRWKLVGLYALILAAVIAGFGALLLLGVRNTALAATDAELETRARSVLALAEFERGRWFVEEKSGLPAEYTAANGLYYSVIDAGNHAVLSSAAGPAPPSADGARTVTHDGRPFRELAKTLTKERDEEEGPPVTVRVVCGKDMTRESAVQSALLRQILVAGPAVLLASLAGGLFLVSRALRPIARIAATAEAIGASDLSRRIDVRSGDELGRLAATLNATFARLQDAFDRQTRFTADASHELRTPLALIAGNVELAQKRPRTAEEYRELVADIGDASARMRSIVEGLLTLARADAKSFELRREPVSLTEIAEGIVRSCRPLAERQSVELTVDSPAEVRATGDPDRLRELLSNIVTNAISYNRPGGRVTVRLSAPGGRALVAVEDTGLGIAPEDLPHVFERFYRADKARSRDAGGSGLGLAISKWIVEAHGGTIEATSEPGKGSRFVVSLPGSAPAIS